MSKLDEENQKYLIEFFKANIHEERTAAYVARGMPFLVFLGTVCLLSLGILRNTVLLLTITAVLNVAMWLWIVSMGFTCIHGVRQAQETIRKAEEEMLQRKQNEKATEPTVSPTTPGSWQVVEEDVAVPESSEGPAAPQGAPADAAFQEEAIKERVHHIIVIPNYKEPTKLLHDTLESLSEAIGSEHFTVVLAMEAREDGAKTKAQNLEEEYKKRFAQIKSCYHPENLEEIHKDGSREVEVRGKASNLKHAVKEVCKEFPELDRKVNDAVEKTTEIKVLTVIDADVILHPMYFEHISNDIQSMKGKGEDPSYTFWQAPQLPWRNFYRCPVVSRVWGYISSLWEFGGVSGVLHGHHHMVYSAYSVPLALAYSAECWDGDVIAEDHHAFLKAWFYAVHESVGLCGDKVACAPVQVRPVMLPSKSTSVNSDEGYWSSWRERWDQAKRHAQGVAELSYALLAAWDMMSSLPVTCLGPIFLWRLLRVVFKPFMMHIVSTLQAISLLVLTLYWLANHNRIPWCPNHILLTDMLNAGDTLLCGLAGAWVLMWPVVVPFMLLIAANFVMIRTCFLLPNQSSNRSKETMWHKEDGSVDPLGSSLLGPSGGKQLATLVKIVVDVVICFGPIMAVYGVLVELLAYCNVLLRGNRFEYKTASKSLARGDQKFCDNYGATSSAQETSLDDKNQTPVGAGTA